MTISIENCYRRIDLLSVASSVTHLVWHGPLALWANLRLRADTLSFEHALKEEGLADNHRPWGEHIHTYIHIYIHMYIYRRVHIHTHTQKQTLSLSLSLAHIHLYTHIYIYILYVYMYLSIYPSIDRSIYLS